MAMHRNITNTTNTTRCSVAGIGVMVRGRGGDRSDGPGSRLQRLGVMASVAMYRNITNTTNKNLRAGFGLRRVWKLG